jgi:PAS domain S-box-containing protein
LTETRHRIADEPSSRQLAAAAFAGALGALALIGWTFDFQSLTRMSPGFIAMNPMTACALLATAFALILPPRRDIVLVRILAGLVTALGIVKLTQLAWPLPIGIDQFLFSDKLASVVGAQPNRMAPNTATVLTLVGAALLTSASRRRFWLLVSQMLALAAIAITMLAVVAFVLDAAAISTRDVYNAMALNTALAFLALAVAILGVNPGIGAMRIFGDRGPAGTLARTALPLALLVPMLIGLGRLSGQRAGFYGTETGVAFQVFANIVVTVAVLTGSIVMLFRSDKSRSERELATVQSESQYRHAEQVGHIGHWQIEYPAGAVQWSDEFYAIFGVPTTMAVTLDSTLALFHPDDAVVAREIVSQAVNEGHGWEIAHRVRRPDGSVRYIKSHGVCDRDSRGEIVAIFGVIVDVTELELSRREAEAATASKAAFLANMSHEIRTPMNGVMGFVELLMDSHLDVPQRRHLLLIQESADALLKLLNDILDLSKIEAGQLEVSLQPSDVRRDIAQCVRLMTPIAERKGLKLTADIDRNFPARVMVDSLRLRQVVFNLLGNAVKFTNRGSVMVSLSAERDRRNRKIMRIGVTDTGVGIAPERKAAIFEAFVQADVSISRRFGGSGLGLSISRRLARLMDGTIDLESREGEGTQVSLALPLRPARRQLLKERRASRRDDEQDSDEPRAQVSILLVEDIDINQELITEMLMRLGHKVEIAANGAEALELARRLAADPEAWDFILMDVQMPVMDGLTATRAIRALGGRAGTIPIIALTANAFAAEMQDCRDAGMDDHIAKPSGYLQLKRAVKRWGGTGTIAACVPADPARNIERVSARERFAVRRLESGLRLIGLAVELAGADGERATSLLAEAAGIAHVLAGTAAMFGEAGLGELAHQVEHEIKAAAENGQQGPGDRALPSIERLSAALSAAPGEPQAARAA